MDAFGRNGRDAETWRLHVAATAMSDVYEMNVCWPWNGDWSVSHSSQLVQRRGLNKLLVTKLKVYPYSLLQLVNIGLKSEPGLTWLESAADISTWWNKWIVAFVIL